MIVLDDHDKKVDETRKFCVWTHYRACIGSSTSTDQAKVAQYRVEAEAWKSKSALLKLITHETEERWAL